MEEEDGADNPCNNDLRSRLYSPFSSESLDFKFTYHYWTRLREGRARKGRGLPKPSIPNHISD